MMAKVIAAINITVDGNCDHREGVPDADLHDHYRDLLKTAGVIMYGRKTYQLMEYWRTLIANPSGERSMDEFAQVMNDIPKLVFSRSLTSVNWHTATLATKNLPEEISILKEQMQNNVLIGSPSLINTATQLHLVDEYQICIHPVIAGDWFPLFSDIDKQIKLELLHTKTFNSGSVILYYRTAKK